MGYRGGCMIEAADAANRDVIARKEKGATRAPFAGSMLVA